MFTTTSIYDVVNNPRDWESWVLLGGNVSFLVGSKLFLAGYYLDEDDTSSTESVELHFIVFTRPIRLV
jgi:hypothetical protein